MHAWTGFLDAFVHLGDGRTRMKDLTTSVVALLVSEACNIGMTPVINPNYEALTLPAGPRRSVLPAALGQGPWVYPDRWQRTRWPGRAGSPRPAGTHTQRMTRKPGVAGGWVLPVSRKASRTQSSIRQVRPYWWSSVRSDDEGLSSFL
ncbi:MAG TPA: Tn3 family transposase [Streptosporangiaceae bacterium]|nr:Tn3 family transposase [Streptosporangiaceae bacterium]